MKRIVLAVALSMTALSMTVFAQDTKPMRKAQHEVAAKTNFSTIKAGDPRVKTALAAKDLAGAKKLLEKEAVFTGEVTAIYESPGNTVAILNFAKNFREAISVVVENKDFAKFPDLTKLVGRRVLVSGKVVEFKKRLEIMISKLDQLKVVERYSTTMPRR